MIRRPPRSTRTDTLFPYTTLFRSSKLGARLSATADINDHWQLGATGEVLSRDTPLRALHNGIKADGLRSEEHTSELQSLMRISYAVFCLKKKINKKKTKTKQTRNVQILKTKTNKTNNIELSQ